MLTETLDLTELFKFPESEVEAPVPTSCSPYLLIEYPKTYSWNTMLAEDWA